MRHLRLAFSLFSLCIFTFTYPAQANEADIQALKKVFQDLLDYQKDVMAVYGDAMSLSYEGELTITPQESYYAVKLPHMKFMAGPVGDQSVFDFGVITANAMRGDKEGTWKMALAFPPNYTFSGPEGSTVSITLGQQNSVGILSEKLGYFTNLDMTFGNVAVAVNGSSPDLPINISMGEIKFFQNLFSKDGELYTGPINVSANNLTFKPNEDGVFTLGEFAGNSTITDMDLPSLQEYKAKVMKHQETLAAMSDPASAEMADPNAIIAMFADLYDFKMDGFGIEYVVKNAALQGAENQPDFKLASGKFGFNIEGLMKESGVFGIDFGYNGIEVQDEPPEYKDIVPRDTNLSIKANNIPIKALTDLASTTMDSIAANPEMAQMAGLGVMMKVPMILSQAGTKFEFSDTYAKGNTYKTTLSGGGKADISAVMSMTADIKSIFAGLDDVLAIAEQHQASPGEVGMYYMQLASTLNKLKSVGKATQSAEGKPAYEFNFQITPEGTMTINGQDAQALMMAP